MIPRLRKAFSRALQLRCPRCGRGKLFRGPFAMHEECDACHLLFEREPGYFVGAIYINYGVTTLIAVTGFLLLDGYTTISVTAQIMLWSVFGVAFPLFFYRYSKSLWLAVDYLFNPEEPELRVLHRRGV